MWDTQLGCPETANQHAMGTQTPNSSSGLNFNGCGFEFFNMSNTWIWQLRQHILLIHVPLCLDVFSVLTCRTVPRWRYYWLSTVDILWNTQGTKSVGCLDRGAKCSTHLQFNSKIFKHKSNLSPQVLVNTIFNRKDSSMYATNFLYLHSSLQITSTNLCYKVKYKKLGMQAQKCKHEMLWSTHHPGWLLLLLNLLLSHEVWAEKLLTLPEQEAETWASHLQHQKIPKLVPDSHTANLHNPVHSYVSY